MINISKDVFRLTIRRYSTKAKPPPKTTKSRKFTFIDSLRLHVRGGSGGHGLQKYGGSGGNGGNIIVRAVSGTQLGDIIQKNPKKRVAATVGQDSRKHWILGECGQDVTVEAPLGVTIKNDFGEQLADLNEDGQEVTVACGGQGGTPDNSFIGQKGEVQMITLDLKLIADVGLVGFPNAGKSTFLSAISRTSPKIADYPFTTIQPYVGTMNYPDLRQITVADLPGLIEGAHMNRGMGHKFLKHIERTKLLLFVVDIYGFQLHTRYPHRTAFETILLLNQELELYNKDVLEKPAILALNKIDLDPDGTQSNEIIELVKGLPDSLSTVDPEFHPENVIKFDGILTMSAQKKNSVDMAKGLIRERLDFHETQKENIRKRHGIQLPKSSGLERRLRILGEQSKVRLL